MSTILKVRGPEIFSENLSERRYKLLIPPSDAGIETVQCLDTGEYETWHYFNLVEAELVEGKEYKEYPIDWAKVPQPIGSCGCIKRMIAFDKVLDSI